MKSLLIIILTILCSLQLQAQTYLFKKNGQYSPYGGLSTEENALLIDSQKEPELLRPLTNRPLEETFELLRIAMSLNQLETAKVASDILYAHPDFEPFLHRTTAKMVDALLKGATYKSPPQQQLDMEVSQTEFESFTSFFRRFPPETRLALFGPCLRAPAYQRDHGDVIEFGPANRAAMDVTSTVRKLTGEVIPMNKDWFSPDLAAARAWWAKNEAKYGWKPPEPRPPSQPTPIPPRVLLGASANAKTPAETSAATAQGQTSKSSPLPSKFAALWGAGIGLLLLAVGVWWRKRTAR